MNTLLIISWTLTAVCIVTTCYILLAPKVNRWWRDRQEWKALLRSMKSEVTDREKISEKYFEHLAGEYARLDKRRRYIFDCYYHLYKSENVYNVEFIASTQLVEAALMRERDVEPTYQGLFKHFGEVRSLFDEQCKTI